MTRNAQILTERQRSVMERIDRRVPIKIIAQELGISETRINQHIRALKDIFQAESLNGLVEIYRRGDRPAKIDSEQRDLHQVFAKNVAVEVEPTVAAHLLHSSMDPHPSSDNWHGLKVQNEATREPQSIEGFLDGKSAIWSRCGVIASIFASILIFILIAIYAGQTIGFAIN